MFSKHHRCLVNIIDVYKQFNFCSFETNGPPYGRLIQSIARSFEPASKYRTWRNLEG